MQSLKQNITQMKKTVYPLLFASLAIVGCVATREVNIPLTSAPEITSFNYQSLDSLPELPRDLSHIEYIDIPAPTLQTIDGSMRYPGISMDDIDTCEMIQLEGFPHIEECLITDIQEDKGLLFITFYHNPQEINGSWYPQMYAIYTRQGKLVAQLGEPIANIINHDEDNNPSHYYEKDPDNDIQYNYSNRLQIDRKSKEVYFNTERDIIVYFDYNGHYKRTEIATIPTVHYTTRGQKVFLGIYHDKHKGLFCSKDGTPCAVVFKNDKKHEMKYMNIGMTTDDLMVYTPNSDTIWQILPTKKIARYVYTGYAKVPEGAEDIKHDNRLESYKQLWRNSLEKYKMKASDKYIFTTYYGPHSPKGGRSYVYQLYNKESGQSFCWSGTLLHQRFYLYSRVETWLSDGSIVYCDYPMLLKKTYATYLESKDSSFHTYTAQDEQFIRRLKLDGGPVLFFVKLKKF